MKKTKNRKFPGVFLPGRMMRTMKLMTLLLVLQTFQVTAKGYSQENITLKMKNVTFAEVVKEIERQSKVTFLYNHDYVRELDRLNPDYSNLNLQEVLDHILTGTNLEYKLIDNTVVITAKQGQDQFEQEIQTTTISQLVRLLLGLPASTCRALSFNCVGTPLGRTANTPISPSNECRF